MGPGPARLNGLLTPNPRAPGGNGHELRAGQPERRDQLRASLPIHRVVEAGDVAALAVHLMTNTALTGAVDDVDGGRQLLSGSGS